MKLRNLLLEILTEAISDSAKKKAKEKFKKENPNLTDANIDYYINTFSERQSSPVFTKKDIFQYKFSELEQIIDKNFSKKSKKDDSGAEVVFKGSEDVVYNKNGLLILLGDLKQKCIRYGKGYSWCISRSDASNMFFSYRMRMNEPVFYFIFDEDKPKTDIWHAMVVYVDKKGRYMVASAKNTGDEQKSWSEIENIQPKLKGLQKLFKHIPLTSQERTDYEKFKNPVSDEKYDKFSYDEKEKYIGFGHDLTEEQIRNTPKPLVSKYAVTSEGKNIPKDIEKSLPTSDQKKLKDNRIEILGDIAKLIYYRDELTPEDLKIKGDLSINEYDNITSLPDNLEVKGLLNLRYNGNIKSLPKGLKVGKLYLNHSAIESLPNDLEVANNLDLSYTNIKSLPNNLKVGGALVLNSSRIKSLPNDLEVGGGLHLSNTEIQSLPDGLRVGSHIDLSSTNIKSLPKGLKVGGDLNLHYTVIQSLPNDLEVAGDLNLSQSLIQSLPDNLKIGGDLNLTSSGIRSLPIDLEVKKNLYLTSTSLKSLPKGLKVGGHLYINDTQITDLPNDLEVGGMVHVSNLSKINAGRNEDKVTDLIVRPDIY